MVLYMENIYHINRVITLSLIKLSGLLCNVLFKLCRIYM